MKLTYQGVDAGSGREKNVSGTGAKNILSFNGLDDKEEADSFYEKNNGKKYDVIVANILADVIIPLSGIVTPLLKDDGVFITSGIINTMEEAVKEAMLANHFEILEINHMKDWVSITAKKG